MNKEDLLGENGESWREWKKYILLNIDNIGSNTHKLREEIVKMRIDIVKLQQWARMSGAVAGSISAVIVSVISFIIINFIGK